ncbi:MAG: Zn-ribbon-containing RNA-binding protein [Labilithrix sp.]|nr:Zn-ribbon-containing RNA-binding protein [Labilithrix sp.]
MGIRKRRRRPRLEAPERLEDVLERAGENRFARKQLPVPLAQWRAAVGPRIADKARPIALERGVLVVKVVTSVWANELSMLAPQIIEKLAGTAPNGAPGIEVKSLRFRVGPLDVIEGIPQRRDYRQIPPPAPLAPDLKSSLARIEDDELRSTIERAARANLAWQTVPARVVSEGPPASRGPRDAGRGSAPPDRTAAGSDGASPRRPGGGSGRPQ